MKERRFEQEEVYLEELEVNGPTCKLLLKRQTGKPVIVEIRSGNA